MNVTEFTIQTVSVSVSVESSRHLLLEPENSTVRDKWILQRRCICAQYSLFQLWWCTCAYVQRQYLCLCVCPVWICVRLHIYLSRERSWSFLQCAGPCDWHMQAPCAAQSCKQELVTVQTCLLLFCPPSLTHSHFHPSSPFNTLHFPSSLPLLPLRARLRHSLDLVPKHRLYPAEITWTRVCFCHVHTILFHLSESRLI